MRISAKGRYALAAVTHMAQLYRGGEYITVIRISERLGISKIYLEQVFSLLKRGGIVTSVKGSQGGYQLAKAPALLTALDVLEAVEASLFEGTDAAVKEKAPEIDAAMQLAVFDKLDAAVREALGRVTLEDLAAEAQRQLGGQAPMFYI